MTISYYRRIFRKYDLGIVLKIDNLFDHDDPHYYNTIRRAPGGDVTNNARVATPYLFYYTAPRSYTLTASLKF
jgi:hypothetical protein